MKATRETVNPDCVRLGTQWLGKTAKPDQVIDELWKLRNFMWKDALTLSRNQY